MRMGWMGWAGLVVGLGCAGVRNHIDPLGPRYVLAGPEAPKSVPEQLKVVTFNIAFSEKIDQAIDELRTHDPIRQPDILLLQEMDLDGVSRIAAALGLSYVYYPASVLRGKDFGNAVLSRFPIVDDEKVLLPHESFGLHQRREAVRATIDLSGRRICACSIHTETPLLSLEKRLEQVRTVVASLPGAGPCLVGGDFNTFDGNSVRQVAPLFAQAGLTRASALSGPSLVQWPFRSELDHVFTRGFRVIASGVDPASRASDHLPVWVMVALEPVRD